MTGTELKSELDVRPVVQGESVSFLIYGKSKVGKSTLANTAPAPRLHLDAEDGLGTKWLDARKRFWDPMKEPPPTYDGTWDLCVVIVRDYKTVEATYEWLNNKPHPFRTVILDSISEIQQRAIDSIAGTDQMKTQNWGELLRHLSSLLRKIRGLGAHPLHPVECIIAICMAKHNSANGNWDPLIQGQIADRMVYWFDICGFYDIGIDNTTNQPTRYLYVGSHPNYVTGERVNGRLGDPLINHPNISNMVNTVFGRNGLSDAKTVNLKGTEK